MPNAYNNNFSFNPKDIALIEEGLRTLSEHHDTIMMIRDGDAADLSAIESKDKNGRSMNCLARSIIRKSFTVKPVATRVSF